MIENGGKLTWVPNCRGILHVEATEVGSMALGTEVHVGKYGACVPVGKPYQRLYRQGLRLRKPELKKISNKKNNFGCVPMNLTESGASLTG